MLREGERGRDSLSDYRTPETSHVPFAVGPFAVGDVLSTLRQLLLAFGNATHFGEHLDGGVEGVALRKKLHAHIFVRSAGPSRWVS
jgi:hypothetical protein